MSEPQRREVRVRRSPRIGVFLAIGAIVGALVAVIAGNLAPGDPTTPTIQAVGFLIVLLAPVGALLGGVVALLVDRASERSVRTVQAERIAQDAPAAVPTPDPTGRSSSDPGARPDEPAPGVQAEDGSR
jgi:predicted phage tail protein